MITFTKVALPYGWLGNMSPHPIEYLDHRWRTSEALFQALRFPLTPEGIAIREAIREKRSPMSAKWVATGHRAQMIVGPTSAQDLENMRLVLRLKVEQHPELGERLRETGDEEIVEDCTRHQRGRALFWGKALRNGQWAGEGWLGQLWMEMRTEARRAAGAQ